MKYILVFCILRCFLLILSRYKNFQQEGGTTFFTDFLSLPLAINVIWTFCFQHVVSFWQAHDHFDENWLKSGFVFIWHFYEGLWLFLRTEKIKTNRVIFEPRRLLLIDQKNCLPIPNSTFIRRLCEFHIIRKTSSARNSPSRL